MSSSLITPHRRRPLSSEKSCSPSYCPRLKKKCCLSKASTRPTDNIIFPLLDEDEKNTGFFQHNLPITKLQMKKRRSFIFDRVCQVMIADKPEKKTAEGTLFPEWILPSKSSTPSDKIRIPLLEEDKKNTGFFQVQANGLPSTNLRRKKRRSFLSD